MPTAMMTRISEMMTMGTEIAAAGGPANGVETSLAASVTANVVVVAGTVITSQQQKTSKTMLCL